MKHELWQSFTVDWFTNLQSRAESNIVTVMASHSACQHPMWMNWCTDKT